MITVEEVVKIAGMVGGIRNDNKYTPQRTSFDDSQMMEFAKAVAGIRKEKDAQICESSMRIDCKDCAEAIREDKL